MYLQIYKRFVNDIHWQELEWMSGAPVFFPRFMRPGCRCSLSLVVASVLSAVCRSSRHKQSVTPCLWLWYTESETYKLKLSRIVFLYDKCERDVLQFETQKKSNTLSFVRIRNGWKSGRQETERKSMGLCQRPLQFHGLICLIVLKIISMLRFNNNKKHIPGVSCLLHHTHLSEACLFSH